MKSSAPFIAEARQLCIDADRADLADHIASLEQVEHCERMIERTAIDLHRTVEKQMELAGRILASLAAAVDIARDGAFGHAFQRESDGCCADIGSCPACGVDCDCAVCEAEELLAGFRVQPTDDETKGGSHAAGRGKDPSGGDSAAVCANEQMTGPGFADGPGAVDSVALSDYEAAMSKAAHLAFQVADLRAELGLDDADPGLVGRLRAELDRYDADATAVRKALTEAGIPEVEPYTEAEYYSDDESVGRVLAPEERVRRLAERCRKLDAVITASEQYISYDVDDWAGSVSAFDEEARQAIARHRNRKEPIAVGAVKVEPDPGDMAAAGGLAVLADEVKP